MSALDAIGFAAVMPWVLRWTFKQVVAVDGLSLRIQSGGVFGLVGPDGSGKITSIRLLAAILGPSGGQATLAGYDTVRQPEAIKQRIG